MRMLTGLAVGLTLFTAPVLAEYKRIGPGLELKQATAYCNLMAMSSGQGYVAYGSPGYVLGASLGNAIGNAIRADQVMDNCMVLQGWEFYRPARRARKLGIRYKSNFKGGSGNR